MSRFQVKKVAVLGAGVMGAQIAAHLVNVKVPVMLFDLPAKEGPKNGIVTKAVDQMVGEACETMSTINLQGLRDEDVINRCVDWIGVLLLGDILKRLGSSAAAERPA